MIRRKHSLNYVDFVRGKWINSLENIQRVFRLISKPELENIKKYDFDILWFELWNNTSWNNIYKKEYTESKEKFNELKKNNFYNLLDDLSEYEWLEPEWEIPKGRKNLNELNIDCAIREFKEETGVKNISIYKNIEPIEEIYKGTNQVTYKTVYYLANTDVETSNILNNEVSKIKWLTIDKVMVRIRPYYEEKIKLIHQIYFFIINLIKNSEKQEFNELMN
jgi:ADP-ribose pyrophosphatase YjhB (NUDIX family)